MPSVGVSNGVSARQREAYLNYHNHYPFYLPTLSFSQPIQINIFIRQDYSCTSLGISFRAGVTFLFLNRSFLFFDEWKMEE